MHFALKRFRIEGFQQHSLIHLAASPVSRHQSRMAICVSRILLDGLQKKERLLVVYHREELMTIFLCCMLVNY